MTVYAVCQDSGFIHFQVVRVDWSPVDAIVASLERNSCALQVCGCVLRVCCGVSTPAFCLYFLSLSFTISCFPLPSMVH